MCSCMVSGRGVGKNPFIMRSKGIAVDMYLRSIHFESWMGQAATTDIVGWRLSVQTNSGIVA